jgi:hypothetical protein
MEIPTIFTSQQEIQDPIYGGASHDLGLQENVDIRRANAANLTSNRPNKIRVVCHGGPKMFFQVFRMTITKII